MDILYKDGHVVVCIKPSGVLSAKDASGKPNMNDILADELGIDEIFTVHRLDREVSGVMVYALTSADAAKLSADAADHTRFIKEYVAAVSGVPDPPKGTFEDLLFKDSAKNKSFVVKKMRRGVKKAKLSYEVLETSGDKSLVRVRLYTGRTHQIRVQFASRKMPIIGDRKYGGTANENGILLKSVKVAFYHPKTNELLTFECDSDF